MTNCSCNNEGEVECFGCKAALCKNCINQCASCKEAVCEDCCALTVDGILCGAYTQWGCGRKYTTCDGCMADEAIHESDLIHCDIDECDLFQCAACAEEHDHTKVTAAESK